MLLGPDGAVFLGVRAHGAELVDGELLFEEADAVLLVNDRSFGLESDGNGREQHDGGRDKEDGDGDAHVKGALQAAQGASGVEVEAFGLKEPLVRNLRERQALDDVLVEAPDVDDHGAAQLRPEKFVRDVVVNGRVRQEQDHGGALFLGYFKDVERRAEAGAGLRIHVALADVAEYFRFGEAFVQELPDLAGPVDAHEQDAQGMGDLFPVAVVDVAPAEAEDAGNDEEGDDRGPVEAPVLEHVGRRGRADDAQHAGDRDAAYGFLEVFNADAVGVQNVEEKQVEEERENAGARVVLEDVEFGGKRAELAGYEGQQDAAKVYGLHEHPSVVADHCVKLLSSC